MWGDRCARAVGILGWVGHDGVWVRKKRKDWMGETWGSSPPGTKNASED